MKTLVNAVLSEPCKKTNRKKVRRKYRKTLAAVELLDFFPSPILQYFSNTPCDAYITFITRKDNFISKLRKLS